MSVTYQTASKASIDRAIAKARQVKPHVKVNGYNDFTVTGSKGDSYQVHFTGKGEDFTAHCTCTGSTNGRVCYHAVSCSEIFKLQVKERAAQAATCSNCGQGEAVPAYTGICQDCENDREEARLEANRRFSDLLEGLPDYRNNLLEMCKTCHMAPASVEGECERCYEAAIYG